MTKTINFAVAGAGGFAFFAVSEFVTNPSVRLVGIFDVVRENSIRFKSIQSDIKIYASHDELCNDADVDLVYISTPPFLHYEQSKAALNSGKHVICEKPATIRLEQAEELRDLANEKQLLFVVNLMQRYNFLFDAVKNIVDKQILGEFLHGFFENYASDEALSREHWFWDEEKSGGILIEHGVHFFDLFSGWFGQGTIVAAQKVKRSGYPNLIDKVQATVLYGNCLVNFYHGFDQPKLMDRQEMRLQFERGELTLYEWVPTRIRINAVVTQVQLEFFKENFPQAEIEILEAFSEVKTVKGRFKPINVEYKIFLDSGDAVEKQQLYRKLVRAMFEDQLAWINNRKHLRKVSDMNAVTSLETAVQADRQAVVIGERLSMQGGF